MSRLVADVIDIPECQSLDGFLRRLQQARKSLPDPATAQVRMRGNDYFGHVLSIRFMRPQTDEEAAIEARYSAGDRRCS